MQGRFEHKIEIESRIEETIKAYPNWFSMYYYSLANNTPASKRTYINKVSLFLKYAADLQCCSLDNIDIQCVTTDIINKYFTMRKKEVVNGRPISNAAIATQISSLKNFFGFLAENRIIVENPMDKALKRPRVKPKETVTYLSKKEKKKIFNNLENGVGSNLAVTRQSKYRSRDKVIFMLGLSLGCRVSAIDEINISDIDFSKKELRVIEKGEKLRRYRLHDKLVEQIKIWIKEREALPGSDETEALFVSVYRGKCKRLTTEAIAKIVRKYSGGVDQRVTPHELRRTFGTEFYEKSHDIYATASALGHADISTTKRYAAQNKEKVDKIFESVANDLF